MVVVKRSISMPDALAAAVDAAAGELGVSVSAWLQGAAERRLSAERGLGEVAHFEAAERPLTAAERADGELRRARLLSGVSLRGSRPPKR